MIGTVEVRCCAAQPQKALAPVFSFKDSPQSFRIVDVPKAIGEWEITRVYVGLNYPDNTNVEKDAVRQGNVWVATVEGCPVAGKTMGGFTIYADGTDENGNPVEGYVLGNGDIYVLDKSEKISALVGKSTMRILDDIPAAPSKGDVVIVNGALKIYDGEEWYSVEVDLSDYYTKSEIDEKVAEIDSSLGELSSSIGALDSSVSDLQGSMSQIESSVSELSSSLTDLDSSLTELNDLAVKYSDSEKVMVEMNSPNSVFTLKMNDTYAAAGNTRILWNDGTNYIARNALRIGVPDEGETVQHMGTTNVQMGGVHNDAIVGIGGGITIFSSAEKGKTKMFMDDDRIFLTTPATVEEGQTLKAIKVANENALSGRSVKMAKRDGEQAQEEVEEQDWHWEYVSADLPEKTSDLTNDSGFITSSDVADSYATKGEVGVIAASVSALGSSVNGLTSSVQAIGSSLSAKRDYLDLTYSYSTPAEALDISNFSDFWDIDATYAAKLTFILSGAGNPITLTYENKRWLNDDYGVPLVEFTQGQGLDPSNGMFVLYSSGEGNIIQFDLEDGTNTQVFNFTSQEYPDFTTLTMTFNGEPAHVVSDTIALTGTVEEVGASVSTLSSQVSSMSSQMVSLSSQVSANASAISANTSAISSITTTLSSYATISYVDASIQDAIGAMLSSQL